MLKILCTAPIEEPQARDSEKGSRCCEIEKLGAATLEAARFKMWNKSPLHKPRALVVHTCCLTYETFLEIEDQSTAQALHVPPWSDTI